MPDPLKAAIAQIFSDVGPEVSISSYREDFPTLWDFDRLSKNRFLVTWSDTPADPVLSPIDAGDCLSPIDWAAAFAEHRSRQGQPWPDILILDLHPSRRENVLSRSHFLALRPDQLPWLSLKAEASFSTILEWLQRKPDGNSGTFAAGRDRFLREIRLNLTEVNPAALSDHHAIANIVGPMILRGKPERESLHTSALLKLLQAAGLVDRGLRKCGQRKHTRSHATVDVSESETGKDLHLLLLDDQAGHGWASWVRECLPDASVSVLENPTGLVSAVRKQLDESGAMDLRDCLELPEIKSGKLPVLLLDLRLFSSRAAEELRFFRQDLLPLVNRFTDINGAFWSPFRAGESSDPIFAATVRAIESGSLKQDSNEHHEALTWLPRVLALVDRSLPIVLFSSTSRRKLIQPLAGYGNVVTEFAKPAFFSGPNLSDQVESARSGLLRAIAKARAVADARNVCRQLRTVSILPGQDGGITRSNRAVEVFIDESTATHPTTGKSGYAVGAVVATAPASDNIARFCGAMEKERLWWGVSTTNRDRFLEPGRFFPLFDLGSRRVLKVRATPKPKTDEIQRIGYLPKLLKSWAEADGPLSRIHAVARHHDVTLSAFGIVEPRNLAGCVSRRVRLGDWDADETDLRHQELTERLLEILLLVHPGLQEILLRDKATLAVDIAVRTLPSERYDAIREILFEDYGFRDPSRNIEEFTKSEWLQAWQRVLQREDLSEIPVSVQGNTFVDEKGIEIGEPELRQLTGWALWGPKHQLISLDIDHPRWILQGVMARWPSGQRPSLIRCRGVGLNDFEGLLGNPFRMVYDTPLPLQVHYLADWMARFAARAAVGLAIPSTAKTMLEQGFIQKSSVSLEEHLQSHAAAAAGNLSEAMRRLNRSIAACPGLTMLEGVEAMIRGIGRQWPDALKERDFLALMQSEGD